MKIFSGLRLSIAVWLRYCRQTSLMLTEFTEFVGYKNFYSIGIEVTLLNVTPTNQPCCYGSSINFFVFSNKIFTWGYFGYTSFNIPGFGQLRGYGLTCELQSRRCPILVWARGVQGVSRNPHVIEILANSPVGGLASRPFSRRTGKFSGLFDELSKFFGQILEIFRFTHEF